MSVLVESCFCFCSIDDISDEEQSDVEEEERENGNHIPAGEDCLAQSLQLVLLGGGVVCFKTHGKKQKNEKKHSNQT